jgi:hypothetical protein
MNPRVKEVQTSSGYRLKLTFTNGEKGIYDCRHLLDFGVFSELREEQYFQQARVEGGTVVWPHEQDICPDTLYLESEKRQLTLQQKRRPPRSLVGTFRPPKLPKLAR